MIVRNRRYARPKKSKKPLVVIAMSIVLAALAAWFFVAKADQSEPAQKSAGSNDQPASSNKETPKPPLIDLQPTVDSWLAKQSAEFGIVVYDPANKQVIASHNPDKQYFAASLYKLFVAYLALQDFQTGAQDPSEILTGGFTRKTCVDKMIRESHSPCGEAMMAGMGPAALKQRLDKMGIKNTVFAGITTTAQDCALVLQYVLEMKDLNAENATFLKDAMRVQDQRFRNGLAKGAPAATWETKVGWNEQSNYHDVGIMTLPSGRSYVVAILGQHNGKSAVIADFAATIYAVLKD